MKIKYSDTDDKIVRIIDISPLMEFRVFRENFALHLDPSGKHYAVTHIKTGAAICGGHSLPQIALKEAMGVLFIEGKKNVKETIKRVNKLSNKFKQPPILQRLRFLLIK